MAKFAPESFQYFRFSFLMLDNSACQFFEATFFTVGYFLSLRVRDICSSTRPQGPHFHTGRLQFGVVDIVNI